MYLSEDEHIVYTVALVTSVSEKHRFSTSHFHRFTFMKRPNYSKRNGNMREKPQYIALELCVCGVAVTLWHTTLTSADES